MASVHSGLLARPWLRYSVAVVAVLGGFLLRRAITAYVGEGLPTYITFYPAVMVAALLGGLGPGLLATVLAVAAVDAWVVTPEAPFWHAHPAEAVGVILFLLMGVLLSGLTDLYLRAREKAAAYDNALALRESQQALRESEARFRALTEKGTELMSVVDATGVLTYESPSQARVLGHSAGSLAGRNMFELVHPEDLPATRSLFQQLIAESRISRTTELRVRTGDGNWRWLEVVGTNLVADAAVGGIVLNARDITERKLAEAALRESHDRMKKVLEVETVGVMFWDLNTGCMTDANDTFLKLMGYSRREVEARELTWQKLTPPEYIEASLAEIRKFQATGRVGPYEKEYLRKDGTRQWLVFAGSSLGNNACVEFCVDISGRKQSEQKLRERTDELTAVLDALPAYVWMGSDPDCRVITGNRAANEMMGVAAGTNISRSAAAKGEAPYLRRFKADGTEYQPEELPMQRAIATRETVRDAYIDFRLPDGRRAETVGNAAPLFDAAGRIRGAVAAFLDITERKRAEEALREGERRFRLVTESLPQLIWTCVADGPCDYLGPQWVRYTGKSEAEQLGYGWLEQLHPADRQRVIDHWQATAGKGENFEIEFRIRRHDGAYRWFRTLAVPVRDEAGKVVKWFGSNTDIDDMKRAAEALRESEERFHASFANAAIGFAMTAPDGRFLDANPAYCALTGYSLEELHACAPSQLTHPDDHAADMALIERLLTNEIRDFVIEHRYVRKGGEAVRVRKSVSLVRGADNTPRWIILLVEDITAQKEAEAALRQSREDLDRAQTVGQIGSWRLDTRRNVLSWSEEIHRIFGVPKGTPLTYETFLKTVHPEDRAYVDTQWSAGLRGEPYDIEHRVVADGQVKWVREKAYLEFDKTGGLLGGFGITQDITERKAAEERLKASLREKEVLLQEIHHRVKNNLQVISSLISLQSDTLKEPALQEALEDVQDRVRTMALVHEKLYESQDLARLNFADYASSLLNYLWRAHRAERKVRLTLAVEAVALPVVLAIPCGLILNELASNALKHAFHDRAEGEVTAGFALDPASRRACLRVQDNGVGLRAGFDWRQSPSLGLRLVQMLTQQLRGTVETGRGPGTEFRVTFEVPGQVG